MSWPACGPSRRTRSLRRSHQRRTSASTQARARRGPGARCSTARSSPSSPANRSARGTSTRCRRSSVSRAKRRGSSFGWASSQIAPLEVTADNYKDLIAHLLGGNTELAARAVAAVPTSDYSEPTVALAAVATDMIFRCPGKHEIAKLGAFVPTYLYQFEYPGWTLAAGSRLRFIDGSLPTYDLVRLSWRGRTLRLWLRSLVGIDLATESHSS